MSQRTITAFFKPKCQDADERSSLRSINSELNPLHSNDKTSRNVRKIDAEEDQKLPEARKIIPKTNALPSEGNKKLCAENLENDLKKGERLNQYSYGKEDFGANYNPAKPNYDPLNDAFWKGASRTPYLALTQSFQQIEDIKGRLKMIEVLGNFFYSVIMLNPEDLLPSVYLSINQLAPAYEGLELGVAEVSIMKAICNTTGRDLKHIKIQTQKTGDLGIVAEQSRIAQRRIFQPAFLTIRDVYNKLKDIAKSSGSSKLNMIQNIFAACRYSEARFFIRSLNGKLRIGIAEKSLIFALATALVKVSLKKRTVEDDNHKPHKISDAEFKMEVENTGLIIRTAYCQCPNYDRIISTLLQYGINDLLKRCPMEPGVPIKPMLAQPTKSVNEVLQRFEGLNITCEWKYDGERAQIHRDENGTITIYSRNQENNTLKYPDVISRVTEFINNDVRSFIVDTEIVAWDMDRKQILPFQILSTRKRKNVNMDNIRVQVCVFVFDIIYLNGEPLIFKPFAERRQILKSNFREMEGVWQFATGCDTNNIEEVQQFLEDSIKGKCEGLMVKTLYSEATYEIAKRSRNWLKLKKDYLTNIGDSLDLLVIGAFKGKGKRSGTYGCFLLACYDSENEEYQSICKIGTGFSDDDLSAHTNFLKDHTIPAPKLYYRFDTSLEPDVWFEPVQIWEVKCADLSLSPIHRAAIGIVDPERGISLRFPRFIRIRDDKTPDHATSAQQIAHMYSSQDQVKNVVSTNDLEDFY